MLLYPTLVISSCCSNVALLEVLIREVPGCGNVITFFQFLFIAVEGFIFSSKFGTVKPNVPIKCYMILVSLFFAAGVSNNYALNFDIPMPLHMIFKSGSLVTNMLLGMIIFKRRYTPVKYMSVLMVTCGIFLTTWASYEAKGNDGTDNIQSSSLIGISLLTFALIVSAFLGIYQETLFVKYGKHPREALFYSHALPLPGFIFLASDIYSKLPYFSSSESVRISLFFNIPWLWLCLLGNVLMQYVCIKSVFILAATFSSLTVTMMLTCRKFMSLIFSVLYFKNPFTMYHWLGTFLVFSGSLLFADIKKVKQKVL